MKTLIISAAMLLMITAPAQDKKTLVVHFETGKHAIAQSQQERLVNFFANLQKEEINGIELRGHTDNVGDNNYNKLLSEKRVLAVQDWLNASGVNAGVISTAYFGEEKPSISNERSDGKAANRRVEIIVTLTPKGPALTLDDILNSLRSESQTFVVQSERDTVLKGKKGTLLNYKANSLEKENGEVITGKVEIILRESMEISEMIGDKHSTVSGDELLETRGMFSITARSGKDDLKLKTGADIVVMVPNRLGNGDMSLFNGQTGGNAVTTWNLTGNPVTTFSPNMFMSCSKTVVMDVITGSRCRFWCRVKKFFTRKGKVSKTNNTLRSSGLTYQVFGMQYCPEFDSLVKKYGITSQAQLIRMVYLPLMKKYKVNRLDLLFKKLQEEKKKNIEMNIGDKKVSFNDLNYYVYSATQLSWKNLDQFMKMPPSQIVAQQTDLLQDSETTLNLVFKRRSMIVSGYIDKNGYFHYPFLPRNEEGTLVAIKVKDGKPMLAIQEIRFDGTKTSLVFNEVALDELRTRIKALNM